MPKEIERKFLLDGEDWRALADGVFLCQGYLAAGPECAVRVRIAGDKAWIGVKGRTSGATRQEFEYPVPIGDAREMIETLAERPLIEKTRHVIPFAGHIWEVDEFSGENKGLIIAEIELENEDEPFEKPAWIGREVTGDPRYYNANLVRNPFRLWGKE